MHSARDLIAILDLSAHPEGGWFKETWRAPATQWQAAEPLSGPHGYALVSCIVAPGFDFGGFTLAPPGWKPGA